MQPTSGTKTLMLPETNFSRKRACCSREALGLDPMRPHDIFRVQSIIRDHLGDLIAAPRPQGIQQRAIADVQVKFRDGAAPDIEREVRRYV